MAEKTKIELRKDGIYVVINHDAQNVKSTILRLVKHYQIKDVDFIAIENAIRTKAEEQKISDNTDVTPRNESIEIEVSEDKMTASIRFFEPVFSGSLLTKDEIIADLNANGVRFGIDNDLIENIVRDKEYAVWYHVAFGEPPKHGVDGYIEYFFETKKKTLKPKELEDGSVDYRNIDLFEVAVEDQVLAVSHPQVNGEDGINVLGKAIPANKAKRAPTLPKGKGTRILPDGVTLVSETSGRIFYMDGRVSILPVLEIGGDVDNTTGNIDFIGTVIVKGGVLSGFTINAGANVEIEGPIEGATIKAKGDIMLMKGVQGGGKALIQAGGDINANFVENARLYASGNINANSIMHSSVKCGGVLTLIGRRGLLVGGRIVVGEKISAKTIGSPMSTVTEIEVGVNPDVLDKYKEAVEEIEKYQIDLVKTEKIVDNLSKQDIKQFSDTKKKMLMEAIRAKILYKTKINNTQAKIDNLLSMLNKKNGRVEASDIIYAGVKITINNSVMFVRDDLNFASLYNKDGKVIIGAHS